MPHFSTPTSVLQQNATQVSGEMARTERPSVVDRIRGTGGKRRGGSEQLIRSHPHAPSESTQQDVNPGNQTQQP